LKDALSSKQKKKHKKEKAKKKKRKHNSSESVGLPFIKILHKVRLFVYLYLSVISDW